MSAECCYIAHTADRIRIAVALAALKHKPSDQSLPSYILDLRAQFQPSTSSAPTTDGSWRTHALSIERDYAALQVKYDAEKIKALALANSALAVHVPGTVPEQSNPSTIKKKAKKKTSATVSTPPLETRHRSDVMSVLEGLHDRMDIPTFPESDSLCSALNDVLLLISLSDVEPTLLLAVAVRAVEAIGKILERIVVRQTVNTPTDVDMLETLHSLLYHILPEVLRTLAPFPRHSAHQPAIPTSGLEPITVLLEKLTALIFNRLIQAFAPLSNAYLNALFLPPVAGITTNVTLTATGLKPPLHMHTSTQPVLVDIRADVLSLFRAMFLFIDGQLHAIPQLAAILHTLRASLILETVRELEHLLVPVPGRSPSLGSEAQCETNVNTELGKGRETSERVKNLATKDTFWYLCAVLHILFSESVAAAPSAPTWINLEDTEHVGGTRTRRAAERLLLEGISDAILRLVTTCRKRESRCRHGGFVRAQNEFHCALETEGDIEGGIGIAKGSRVQGQDAYTGGKDKDQPLADVRMDDLGETVHGQEALLIGVSGAAVGVGSHVDHNPSGRLGEDSGKVQHAASMPQRQVDLADQLEGHLGHDMIDLDEISHEMLLGVIERYWVWSKS